MDARWHARVGRWLLWLPGLAPLGFLLGRGMQQGFGPDPADYLSAFTGDWAVWFLLASLAVTPARRWLGWGWLLPYRQVLGLLAWLYAGLHLLVYLALWIGWDWAGFIRDLEKRAFILLGMLAYALLCPLALTSGQWARRQLGRHWVRLHRLVYVALLAVLVHVFWQSRAGVGEAWAYIAIALLLALLRWPLRPPSARPAG